MRVVSSASSHASSPTITSGAKRGAGMSAGVQVVPCVTSELVTVPLRHRGFRRFEKRSSSGRSPDADFVSCRSDDATFPILQVLGAEKEPKRG
jgi:hypothetical protein